MQGRLFPFYIGNIFQINPHSCALTCINVGAGNQRRFYVDGITQSITRVFIGKGATSLNCETLYNT